jgi:hypothetical protein
MKSFNTKVILSAMGVALLSTSSFAQSPYPNAGYGYNRYAYENGSYAARNSSVGSYPNPVADGSSASSVDSGASFNLDRGYPAYYEFTGD